MKLLVCIKQVPGSSNVAVDPVTGVLRRSDVAGKLNPYDLYALETALTLAERYGGTVEVLTMGPPQARAAVEEAVCMGAAGGTVLSDRAFAGADVLATAYTLSQGARLLGFDLILCGKQTTDGDTAQVGAELAEFLGLPNVSNVLHIDSLDQSSVTLTAALDGCILTQQVALPCLLSMESDICTPRLPSYRIRRQLDSSCVKIIGLEALPDTDPTHYGLNGSATQVERIFAPEKRTERQVIDGTVAQQAEAVATLLRQNRFL